jgi:hypothetical protein
VIAQCGDLRTELSRVVAELRRSVFLLRNEADTQSLGETVRALGRPTSSPAPASRSRSR